MFSENQSKRYSRHFILPEIGIFGQEKLLKSSVLVIGAGGLGSIVIMYLAAAGVGKIGIADCDEVEPSNFNRQIIHSPLSLGVNKALSASEWVTKFNPDVSVDTIKERLTAQNIASTIANYDFIVDCTDNFETKFLINDACVAAQKPFCHGGAAGLDGQVMTVAKGSACLRCVLGSAPLDAPTCAELGVLGSVVGVIGSIQATEAIEYLVGKGEPLLNKLLVFDARTMKFQTIKLKPDPNCSACGR